MPSGRPIDTQDKLSVVHDGDLYVFGDNTIETYPCDLPLSHPFIRIPNNSNKNSELGFELNG